MQRQESGASILRRRRDRLAPLMGTGIEVLAIGNCVLRKEEQDPNLEIDYKDAFQLD